MALAWLGCAPAAWAHKASDAYLQLAGTETGLSVRIDVALRDLDAVLELDADGNGQLNWGEVRTAWPVIEGYVTAHVQVQGCVLSMRERLLERRSDGVYAALSFTSGCTPTAAPPIRYTLFADTDPTHRGLAQVALPGQPAMLSVLDPRQPVAAVPAAPRSDERLPAAQSSNAWSPTFVREGVRHIVNGYDHVLFLMCLLLPAVMRRTHQGWQAQPTFGQALRPVLGIVTAFTVAHSITLGLAALKWVSLPAWWVEPAIAASIVVAALNNLWPIFRGRAVWMTFAFGLLHGFGFASVLGELNLPTAQFALALLQFNAGLELGQLMIVLVAVSAMFVARNSMHYVPVYIRGGSAVAIMVAMLWFVERTADVKLLPF